MSKDIFSAQAGTYARYRPDYPAELYEYILRFIKNTGAAWDCATGNGQAALALSKYFNKVIATDFSEKQLSLAVPNPKIEYMVAVAEHSGLPDDMFDLITVAQAYHWLDFEAFEKEVKRVAKKDAVIAVWVYNLFKTGKDVIDAVIWKFYSKTVGPYWDKERKYVEENYKSVPFNFITLPSKEFFIKLNWSLDDGIGFLNSWSSVQHFIDRNGFNPVEDVRMQLENVWKEKTEIIFPLSLKLGIVK